jgi:carboxypeptidase PM20D1
MVGVFEKGKAEVRFTASSGGGHASAPAAHSPVARLAAFVNEMETKPVFRRRMPREVAAMFSTLAPYASFPLKLVFSNLWLFRPVLLKVLPAISAQAGAMIRTTAAFTMMRGSDACNVMPQKASVWADVRFIPHQGKEESLAVLRKRAEKHGLEMDVIKANDYTEPVDIAGEAFMTVQRVIAETFPGCAGSPYVMTGATDSRFYQRICPNVVRFAPVIYGPEQMKGMHGINENIRFDCLPGAVDFYKNLIRAMG